MSRLNFNPDEAHKKLHIKRIAQHYKVKTQEIILFDDDEGNVHDTNGEFTAIKVRPDTGLLLRPILRELKELNGVLNMGSSNDKYVNSGGKYTYIHTYIHTHINTDTRSYIWAHIYIYIYI